MNESLWIPTPTFCRLGKLKTKKFPTCPDTQVVDGSFNERLGLLCDAIWICWSRHKTQRIF